MPSNLNQVEELLRKLDIECDLSEHEAVYTVEDAKKIRAHTTHPVKNLLLTNKKRDRFYLVIWSGEDRLDLKQFARRLNEKKLQFASSSELMQCLDVSPGSVSVFSLLGVVNPPRLIVEQRLQAAGQLGFHPNINTQTITISGDDLVKVARALQPDFIQL